MYSLTNKQEQKCSLETYHAVLAEDIFNPLRMAAQEPCLCAKFQGHGTSATYREKF